MQIVLLDAESKCAEPLRRMLERSAISFATFETLKTLESAELLLQRSHPDLMFIERDAALKAAPDWFARLRKLDVNIPLFGVSAEPLIRTAGADSAMFDFIVLDDSEQTHHALNFVRIAGETRQALRIAEEKLRLAEEMAVLGTWEWHVASGEIVLSENNRAMFGLTSNEPGSYADWLKAVHPDDQLRAAALLEQALAGSNWFDEQIRVNRAQHGLAPDYRILRSRGQVLRRDDGSPFKIVGLHKDISDEVALAALSLRSSTLEERLNAAQAQFQTLFDSSIDCLGFLVPDESGKLVYAAINPAAKKYVPVPFEQVRGQAPIDLLGGIVGETVQANVQRCYEIGEVLRCQPTFEIMGQSVTFDAVCSPVRGADGELLGVLGSVRDISELRRTERMLRQAQKLEAIGQLAGGVAHDFNNLLASTGACFRLLDKHVESGQGRRILEQGRRTVDRGRSLTERLLRFSRPGRSENNRAELDICLRETADTLVHTLGSGIRIEVSPQAPGAVAAVDTREVELALINLAVNARDAMPDGGTLQLATRRVELKENNIHHLDPGCYIAVTVRDDGTGMAADTLAQATDLFFTTKTEGKGTGLGLSIVAKFMHDQGGEVELESEVGRGTCVSLFFPEVRGDQAG